MIQLTFKNTHRSWLPKLNLIAQPVKKFTTSWEFLSPPRRSWSHLSFSSKISGISFGKHHDNSVRICYALESSGLMKYGVYYYNEGERKIKWFDRLWNSVTPMTAEMNFNEKFTDVTLYPSNYDSVTETLRVAGYGPQQDLVKYKLNHYYGGKKKADRMIILKVKDSHE